MSKRVLIVMLAVIVLSMWGSAADAFNRIRGIIIRHGSVVADVELCGDPLVNTQLTLDLEVKVEIACANPGGQVPNGQPGHPTFNLTFGDTQTVTTGDLSSGGDFDSSAECTTGNNNNATATKTFTFDLPPQVKCKQKWTKISDSELFSVEAIATWNCTELGPECQNPGDPIEAISVECADVPPVEGGVACNDNPEHIGPEGEAPPPLPPVTADTHYNFIAWVNDNGEQDFAMHDFEDDDEQGLTLTAQAGPSNVYMDSGAGMGVCSQLADDVCDNPLDDSVSDNEVLDWEFSSHITQVTVELANDDHGIYVSGSFDYQYGSQSWQTTTTDGSGNATLMFDISNGSSDQLKFRTTDDDPDSRFYIQKAWVRYETQ